MRAQEKRIWRSPEEIVAIGFPRANRSRQLMGSE